jgi:hypothetical protein
MSTLTPEQEKMLERARALLAKAESTEFPDEAELLSAKAAEILSKFQIDAALLAAKADMSERPVDKVVYFEDPYAKQHMYLYFHILKAFGGDGIVISHPRRNSRVKVHGIQLHVFAMAADLQVVDVLYTSLYHQGVTQANHVPKYEHARTYKVSFWWGFTSRIYNRLTEVHNEAVAETKTPGTALVLSNRSLDIKRAMVEKYDPKNVSTYSRSKAHSDRGYEDGKRAGDSANLHNRQAAGQPRRTSIGR